MILKKVELFFLIFVSVLFSSLFSMKRSVVSDDKLAKRYIKNLSEQELKDGSSVQCCSDVFRYHLLNKYFLLQTGRLLYDFNISKNSEKEFLLSSLIRVFVIVNKNFEQGLKRCSFFEFSLAKNDSLLNMCIDQEGIGLLLQDLLDEIFFEKIDDDYSLEYTYGQNFDSIRIDFDNKEVAFWDSNEKSRTTSSYCFEIPEKIEGYKIFGFFKERTLRLDRHNSIKRDLKSVQFDDQYFDDPGCCSSFCHWFRLLRFMVL